MRQKRSERHALGVYAIQTVNYCFLMDKNKDFHHAANSGGRQNNGRNVTESTLSKT